MPNLLRCNEVLVNIGEALMQGQLLQEAFACEKPEQWIVSPKESMHVPQIKSCQKICCYYKQKKR